MGRDLYWLESGQAVLLHIIYREGYLYNPCASSKLSLHLHVKYKS